MRQQEATAALQATLDRIERAVQRHEAAASTPSSGGSCCTHDTICCTHTRPPVASKGISAANKVTAQATSMSCATLPAKVSLLRLIVQTAVSMTVVRFCLSPLDGTLDHPTNHLSTTVMKLSEYEGHTMVAVSDHVMGR